ncbi:MAG: DUF4836 family protein [Flavobacteriales bacterium]
MKAKTIFIILSVLGVSGIALWFFSQKSDKHLKLIPKDALFVGTADWAGLAKKADFAKISESEFYKKIETETQDEEPELNRQFKEILNNPGSTGINLFSEIYFYVTNLENVTYTGCAIAIKDVGRFEQMLMRIENNLHIQVGYNCHYTSVNSQVVMAWDENSAFIAFADSYRLEDNWHRMFAEWSFGQLEEQTMKNHAIFKDMMDDGGDVRAFINGPAILQSLKRELRGEASLMTKNMAFLEDNYMMMGLNFEDDAIVWDMKVNSLNPEMEKWTELGAEGLSDAHMSLISDKAISVGALSIHMDKFMAHLMQFPDAKKEVDKALQSMEMSLDEFTSAFSGELSIAWNGFLPMPERPKELVFEELLQLSPEAYSEYQNRMWASSRGPVPAYSISFSSSNKDALRKLMDKLVSKEEAIKENNGDYTVDLGRLYYRGFALRMVENPIGFSLTNDTTMAEKLRNGNAGGPSAPVKDFLKGKTFASYYNLDIASYPDSMGKTFLNYAGWGEAGDDAMVIFKSASFYGGIEKSELRVDLRSGPDNSLHEVIMHIGNTYIASQKRMEELRNQMEKEMELQEESWQEADVEAVPPPVVEEWNP